MKIAFTSKKSLANLIDPQDRKGWDSQLAVIQSCSVLLLVAMVVCFSDLCFANNEPASFKADWTAADFPAANTSGFPYQFVSGDIGLNLAKILTSDIVNNFKSRCYPLDKDQKDYVYSPWYTFDVIVQEGKLTRHIDSGKRCDAEKPLNPCIEFKLPHEDEELVFNPGTRVRGDIFKNEKSCEAALAEVERKKFYSYSFRFNMSSYFKNGMEPFLACLNATESLPDCYQSILATDSKR